MISRSWQIDIFRGLWLLADGFDFVSFGSSNYALKWNLMLLYTALDSAMSLSALFWIMRFSSNKFDFLDQKKYFCFCTSEWRRKFSPSLAKIFFVLSMCVVKVLMSYFTWLVLFDNQSTLTINQPSCWDTFFISSFLKTISTALSSCRTFCFIFDSFQLL